MRSKWGASFITAEKSQVTPRDQLKSRVNKGLDFRLTHTQISAVSEMHLTPDTTRFRVK